MGIFLFSILLISGLFFFSELFEYSLSTAIIIFLLAISVVLALFIIQRLFSWDFTFYKDVLTISRSFGIFKNQSRNVQLSEITKMHFHFVFKMDSILNVYTKDGKKYTAFFDKKTNPGAELIALCMSNNIQFSGSGGSWGF